MEETIAERPDGGMGAHTSSFIWIMLMMSAVPSSNRICTSMSSAGLLGIEILSGLAGGQHFWRRKPDHA